MALFDPTLAAQIDLRLAVADDVIEDYPRHVRCREHNDKHRGNLAVYRDHLHCFVCGWHESRTIAALAYLLKVSLKEAVAVAPRYTHASLDGYRERTALETRLDPLPGSLATIYHDVLYDQRSSRLAWLHARGLNDATLRRFQVGHDGMRFTIPILDREGRLVSMRYRRDDHYAEEKSAKYLGMKGRNGNYLYPEQRLMELPTLVLCEGEFDCMRLWQEGIPAVTVTNGAGQMSSVPQMLRASFPSVTTLIVASDADEPGQLAGDATCRAAEALGFTVGRLRWEGDGKDVSEAFQLGALTKEMVKETLCELATREAGA